MSKKIWEKHSGKPTCAAVSLRVAVNGLQRMFRSVPFYVLVFFTFAFWYLFGWNIKELAAAMGYGVTPYLLPHFFGSNTFRVQGRLLLVLVTCQAPFLFNDKEFTIQRTGRVAWCIGQMVYIVFANIFFMLLMFTAQIVTLLPYVSFDDRWGTVIRTVAEDTSVLHSYHGYGTVKSLIVSEMTPAQATLKQMLLCILLGVLIGTVSFLINGLTGKHTAAVIMVAGVLSVDYLSDIDFYFGTSLAGLNPFNWVSLTEYLNGTYDFWSNVGKMTLLCVAFMWLCVRSVQTRRIRLVE